METADILKLYDDEIVKIYKEQQLDCIRRLDASYKLFDKELLVWYHEATRKGSLKFKNFNYQKNLDELIIASDEIMYFTAHLYLYRPFLNDPISDSFMFSGRMIYPNYQNRAAKRYYMFANVVAEKLYNFWDRIGDLIASYFPDIPEHKIYFGTALQAIPSDLHSSENFKWLNNFKENDFKLINGKRKKIVHYFSVDTDFKHEHLSYSSDEEGIKKLLKEREDLPDFYKNQISNTFTGLKKTLNLIAEISELYLKEIE